MSNEHYKQIERLQNTADLLERIKVIKDAEDLLAYTMRKALEDLAAHIKEHPDDDYGFLFLYINPELGWDCISDENPTGKCMYYEPIDPAWDNCIFCGHPYERK